MLKVVVTFDCERLIGFKQGNPRWNRFEKFKGFVNNFIKRFRYNERGFELIRKIIEKENFPCTMMLVGSLFENPERSKVIEFGYHTLNHLPLTLIDDDKLKKEIENKWDVKSITAPMWMVEDEKNPNRIFKALTKERYTHTVYRGRNNGIRHSHFNTIKNSFKKEVVTCVHVSNFFEGNWGNNKIKAVKKDIFDNLDAEGIYLLTSHDFTHKNSKNLISIISFLKRLEKEKKIKIKKLCEIV